MVNLVGALSPCCFLFCCFRTFAQVSQVLVSEVFFPLKRDLSLLCCDDRVGVISIVCIVKASEILLVSSFMGGWTGITQPALHTWLCDHLFYSPRKLSCPLSKVVTSTQTLPPAHAATSVPLLSVEFTMISA